MNDTSRHSEGVEPAEGEAGFEVLADSGVRSIAARVHGTYLVRPPAGEAAAAVVGFHGYGELAEHMLEALARLPGASTWLLCSVQALHPFYKKTGDVVAGWMTRFDRERAIADNLAYVAGVTAALRTEFPALRRVAFAGFSQGVAMAYRAAAAADPPAVAVVALAGDVPPEIEVAHLPPVLIGAGRDDGWFGPAEAERDAARLAAAGVPAEAFPFAGGHEWTEAFLTRAGAFLAERFTG